MNEIDFAFASQQDESDIKQILSKCQLPTDGIAPHLEHFILARSKNSPIGVIGLEVHGGIGLLRSLAVVSEARGKGVGKSLYARLIAHAHTQNVNELYLLTTTAESFFAKQDFHKIDRNLAPTSLQSSMEFKTLCPNSAVCMVKRLSEQAIYFPQEILKLKPDVPGARMWGVALDKTLLTYFEVEPRCRFDRHCHESEQITMVLEGELFFELDSIIHCVKQGEVIAIPSNVPHAVFTLDKHVKAIDAWSPVMPQYIRPNKTLQPTAHTAGRG